MMNGTAGPMSDMTLGMGAFGILAVVLVLLVMAALIKYIFFG